MYTIDYHGDDYGISKNNCIRFIELMKASKIDSISIIPNMSFFNEGTTMLRAIWNELEHKPMISVHLNLIDGFSLSKASNRHLTRKLDDGRLVMSASWIKLLLFSYLPGKKKQILRQDISNEISMQLRQVYENLPDGCELRIDSHVHTHMIPIVFDALLDVLYSEKLVEKTEYIRVSKEPFWMFFTTSGVRGTFSFINVIKNILLSVLSIRVERKLKTAEIDFGYLCGLIMTGHMDRQRVDLLLPKINIWMEKRSKKGNSYLEILCHPGRVLREEHCKEFGEEDAVALLSDERDIEYNMLDSRL